MAHTTATITRISPTTAQIIAVSNCGFGENSEIIRSGDMYPKTSAITPNPQLLTAIICAVVGLILVIVAVVWAIVGAVKKRK